MATILTALCMLLLTHLVSGQDCIYYGHPCGEDAQCCGGCCISGVCIDTYRSCHELRDPCIGHYCPQGLDCFVFKPEDCPGCDVKAICQ